MHAVLYVSAADRSRRFRTKADRAVVAIFEGVHLFADDIGIAADGTGKKFGGFEDGRANFAKAEGSEDLATEGFDAIPQLCVWRQKIAGTFDGLEFAFFGHERRRQSCDADSSR